MCWIEPSSLTCQGYVLFIINLWGPYSPDVKVKAVALLSKSKQSFIFHPLPTEHKMKARLLSWNVLHRNKAKETLAAAEWARCVQILKRFTARVDSRFQTNDIVPPKALLVPLSEALVQCVTDWSHNLLGSTTNTCSWKEHPLTLNLPLKNINKKSQNFKPSSCFIHIPGPPSFR